MRLDTPVTNRAIVIDRASTWRPKLTWRPPTGIHGRMNRWTVSAVPGRDRKAAKVARAAPKEAKEATVPTHPDSGSPSLRPRAMLTRKPARGRATMA